MARSDAAVTGAAAAEPTRRLADVYADRHERLDRFIVMYAVPSEAMRRVGIDLHSRTGYALFRRLQALHDEIADSRDSLLSAGSLAPIAGTAVLSTVTVVATAVIQHYVQRML